MHAYTRSSSSLISIAFLVAIGSIKSYRIMESIMSLVENVTLMLLTVKLYFTTTIFASLGSFQFFH